MRGFKVLILLLAFAGLFAIAPPQAQAGPVVRVVTAPARVAVRVLRFVLPPYRRCCR